MPQRYVAESESDSTEYSDSDITVDATPRRRPIVRRRSFTRRRPSPLSNAYSRPRVIEINSIRKSASTGGRHHRRADEPIVLVDVRHDGGSRRNSTDNYYDRHWFDEEDDDDIKEINIGGNSSSNHRRQPARSSRRRRRRSSLSISRSPSPRSRDDRERTREQRFMTRDDIIFQDIELARQRREIDQLERELETRRRMGRERRESRSSRYPGDDYIEAMMMERLRLEQAERFQRSEEVRRHMAESEEKVRELDIKATMEEARRPAMHAKFLNEFESREHPKAERERIIKEAEKEARMALEEEMMKKELMRLEQAKKQGELEGKEKQDKAFRDRPKEMVNIDERINAMLDKPKMDEKKDGTRPGKETYIKVHRKYLSPETLIAYQLTWGWDERDKDYVIIKQWVSEELQEELFAHTRRLNNVVPGATTGRSFIFT